MLSVAEAVQQQDQQQNIPTPHEDIVRFLSWIMTGFDDDVLEMRVIPSIPLAGRDKPVLTGYFSTPERAAQALTHLSNGVAQCYCGLNPRRRKLWPDAPNHLLLLGSGGRKESIPRITAVLIDFDPVRPNGVPSNQEELTLARDRAREVARWLREQGARSPLVVMSGNGYHLLYRIPPQNPETFPRQLRQFLEYIADRFGGRGVEIDRGVWDAPRITKIAGTVSVKGTPSEDRPLRRARIVQWSDPIPDEGLLKFIERICPLRNHHPKPRVDTRPVKANGAKPDPERIAQLVAPYWQAGSRHQLALGIAGLLASAGWDEESVQKTIEAILKETGDNEAHDRLRAVRDTFRSIQEGKQTAGYTLLKNILPDDVLDTLTTIVEQGNAFNVNYQDLMLTSIFSVIVPKNLMDMIMNPPEDYKQRLSVIREVVDYLKSREIGNSLIWSFLKQQPICKGLKRTNVLRIIQDGGSEP